MTFALLGMGSHLQFGAERRQSLPFTTLRTDIQEGFFSPHPYQDVFVDLLVTRGLRPMTSAALRLYMKLRAPGCSMTLEVPRLLLEAPPAPQLL